MSVRGPQAREAWGDLRPPWCVLCPAATSCRFGCVSFLAFPFSKRVGEAPGMTLGAEMLELLSLVLDVLDGDKRRAIL